MVACGLKLEGLDLLGEKNMGKGTPSERKIVPKITEVENSMADSGNSYVCVIGV